MHKDIVLSKKPELEDPYLIASWPGMGEVAIRAASYLKDKLQAEMFGFILPKNYFNPVGAWVERNLIQSAQLPQSQFFYWKNPKGTNDLIFFLCESQPPLEKGYLFAERVLEVAKEFKVKRIFTFAAFPQPIDHTQEPGVWATATSPKILEELKDFKVKFMNSGQIAGLNGLLLSVAKDKKMEGVCLLGEIPIYTIQIENPKASLAILEVMIEILDIEIDLSELAQRARFIEEEIEKLVEYLKSGMMGTEGITDEEIEKLKKGLSSLTKLPKSAQEKIEKLFEEAKKDISKANELKKELDRWNVYKEYEDRFLDLFKKPGKKEENA
ncbi:MAG: PAC2 family protein [Candidatus Omnitrophica bacterium]|nr:PAC2 family protein [Candidatus Omnitrophota bacterium]MCM8793583.1 PAC2 family protein [Candidatus Omnitrophota bacterium]